MSNLRDRVEMIRELDRERRYQRKLAEHRVYNRAYHAARRNQYSSMSEFVTEISPRDVRLMTVESGGNWAAIKRGLL